MIPRAVRTGEFADTESGQALPGAAIRFSGTSPDLWLRWILAAAAHPALPGLASHEDAAPTGALDLHHICQKIAVCAFSA